MVNEHKKYTILTSCGIFGREAIQTHFIKIDENIFDLINKYIVPCYEKSEIVAISSKIVSLYQHRVVYKKDMTLTAMARFLSKFATRSEAGIGVDSVWKMQYAIDRCGKAKIIFASVCAGIGKLFGKRGIFYDIAGDEVRNLDGFYDKSFKEYGEFGIEVPLECNELCNEIYRKTGVSAFIADANDFTRDIFGKADTITYDDKVLCEILADNPAGQSDQCTPFIIIRYERGIDDD